MLKHFNLTFTTGALEAAWITGFNEKIIRDYRKDFLALKKHELKTWDERNPYMDEAFKKVPDLRVQSK